MALEVEGIRVLGVLSILLILVLVYIITKEKSKYMKEKRKQRWICKLFGHRLSNEYKFVTWPNKGDILLLYTCERCGKMFCYRENSHGERYLIDPCWYSLSKNREEELDEEPEGKQK
ncbi:MAG: hypothetical protein ABID54_03075 [Pseudomonadota bacterium]